MAGIKINWVMVLLICIFFGWLGIHRYLVGKLGTGLIYTFTGGLLGIGWIYDIVMIVIGKFTTKSGSTIHA